jgi:aminotransferase/cystathionine beta-lyase
MLMYSQKADVSPNIVPLSVADMELKNPPEVIEGLKKFLDEAVLGYTMPTDEYKKALRDWQKRRHGWEIEDDWVIQTPGVVTAFNLCVQAYTNPGDGVIIQPPVYYPFKMAVDNNERTLVNNPLKIVNGRYEIDFDDFEKKAKDPKNKLFILCSPHNPVGRVWTKTELAKLADICNRNGVVVCSDEIHNDLLMPGVTHTVWATLGKEAEQNCVVCTAPSKTFSLAGMATSNIMIPNPALREKFQQYATKSSIRSVTILGLKACEIAYSQSEGWLDEFLKLMAANYNLAKDFFTKNFPKIKVYDLEGTYLMWFDVKSWGLDIKEQEKFMINEAEWFTDEGYLFGEEGAGFERINIACPTAVLQEALDRLLAACKKRGLV